MLRTLAATAILLMLLGSAAEARVVSKTVEYDDAGAPCEGYLAYDDAQTSPRPGVLVVHEWYGLDDYAKMRCDMLAKLGYVAFAADIFGKGVRPTSNAEAGAETGKWRKDPKALRQRALAALDVLKAAPGVDAQRLAAIGYCFGGGTVLELARAGTDLRGVVSFHGSLDTSLPAAKGQVKAKVLIEHGAADPHITWDQVQAVIKEFTDAGADLQFKAYSGVVHKFTNLAAHSPEQGMAYDAKADARSWQDMQDFFQEIFK